MLHNPQKVLQNGTNVNSVTVSLRLIFSPASKPRLVAAMKFKRLAFAKQHEIWTSEKWCKIMFPDESICNSSVCIK